MNPRPKAYESSALPLSYSGKPLFTAHFLYLRLTPCLHLQNDTPSATKEIDRSLKYNPVFNRRNECVRGLWERNGNYYAQVQVRGWIGQVPLHGATVADAAAARQVLKLKIKSGEFLTPAETEEKRRRERPKK